MLAHPTNFYLLYFGSVVGNLAVGFPVVNFPGQVMDFGGASGDFWFGGFFYVQLLNSDLCKCCPFFLETKSNQTLTKHSAVTQFS